MSEQPNPDMNAILLAEIGSTLKDFKESRDACRKHMAEAIHLAETLGEYVGKARTSHRSHLNTYLHGTLTIEETKAFATVAVVAAARSVASDKRALQCLGLIDYQKPRLAKSNEPRQKPSLFSQIRRIDKIISASIEKRPVAEMDADERAQLKDSLNSIARIYVELCKP